MMLTIPVSAKEQTTIRRRAKRAGISFEEYTRRALVAYVPESDVDSLDTYTNAASLKRSLRGAKAAYKAGRYSTSL